MTSVHLRALATAAVTLAWMFHATPMRAADASGPRPRAALVIGNAEYTAINPLESSANDARDMCDALTVLGYTASCFADVKDAREFKARIQDFTAALKPKSEVVFYYAGHAVQIRGENYLVPVGAKLRTDADVARESVSLSYLMTQLLQAKHYLSIVILDASRGNPWPGSSHGILSGLAPITAIPRGTMVMYATAANGVSAEGTDRNGVLTKNLLANIKSPGLTADELFKRVSEGVQADGAAAIDGMQQTPALYTNFTGEFCFAGCIDKVARAELEKLQKANEEQLAETRKQKAELEARRRDAQAKLLANITAMNCDPSELNGRGQCFAATPETAVKAVATALIQRGFIVNDDTAASSKVEGVRITDDPQAKNLTNVLTITASVKNVATIGRCVVTLSANQKTILHDEYHTWSTVAIIPVATSKQYSDVVKNDITITDSGFYRDLLAAIAVAAGSPSGDSAPAAALGVNEHRYDAPPDRSEQALIQALISQGYVVKSFNPAFGTVNLFRRTQDKDKRYSTSSDLIASVTTAASGTGSRVQIAVNDIHVMRRELAPGPRISALAGEMRSSYEYETVVVHEGAVTDPGFNHALFAAMDSTLQGNTASSRSPHSQPSVLPADQTFHAASDALTQRGYYVSSSDEALRLLVISKRTAIPLKSNDGWSASYVNATIYIKDGAANDSICYVAATSQDSIFRASPTFKYSIFFGTTSKSSAPRDCRVKKKCTLDELQSTFVDEGGSPISLESVTGEGDADAAVYSEIFSIISPQKR
jgi:hypothetical protein